MGIVSQPELFRMKIISLFFLLFGLAQCSLVQENGKPNENCWLQCDWTGYLALVTCQAVGEVACTCVKPEGDSTAECGLPEVKGPMTWKACHDLAHDYNNVIPNEYFRFEKKGAETYCYFLDSCNEVSSGDPCVPFETATCVAGHSDIDCDPADKPTCELAKWDDAGLHWTCQNSNRTINPYKGEEMLDEDGTGTGVFKVPQGTICNTGSGNDKCSTWDWTDGGDHGSKVAKAKCGATEWELLEGSFQLQTNDIEPVLILPNLNDGVCICTNFELLEVTLTLPGLSLICNKDLDGNAIQNDNACALICDGHFIMYIECYKGKWMNTAEYPFEEKSPEDIIC